MEEAAQVTRRQFLRYAAFISAGIVVGVAAFYDTSPTKEVAAPTVTKTETATATATRTETALATVTKTETATATATRTETRTTTTTVTATTATTTSTGAEKPRVEIKIDYAKCSLCGTCIDVCSRVFWFTKEDDKKRPYVANLAACTRCRACEVRCLEKAICVDW